MLHAESADVAELALEELGAERVAEVAARWAERDGRTGQPRPALPVHGGRRGSRVGERPCIRRLVSAGPRLRLQQEIAAAAASIQAEIDRVLEVRAQVAKSNSPDVDSSLALIDSQVATLQQNLSGVRSVDPRAGTLVQDQTTPVEQSGFSPLLFALFGGLAGFLLGLVLAFVRDGFSRKPRDSEQTAEIVGAPVLATVPKTQSMLVVRDDPQAESANAFHVLASGLEGEGLGRDVGGVLVANPLGCGVRVGRCQPGTGTCGTSPRHRGDRRGPAGFADAPRLRH